MQRSLSLCVPPGLLPSSHAVQGFSSSLPLSEASSSGHSSQSDELSRLNLRPALHELDRGFSESAARRQPPAPAPPPARTPAGAAQDVRRLSAAAAQVADNLPEGERATAQTTAGAPPPEVQRVGSRHQRSHTGLPLSPASASSGGWPSTQGSGQDGGTAEQAAAKAAAPSSIGDSPRSSTIGGYSRSASPEPGMSVADSSLQWLDGPGSAYTVSTVAAAAAAPSPGASAQPAAVGPSRGRPAPSRTPVSARSPASTRPPSRTSSRLGGYLAITAAAEGKRNRPGSAGVPGSRPSSAGPSTRPSSVAPSSRPGSASPTKHPARPCSGRPALQARVARQLERKDPAEWTVSEVCDWLDLIGLGQYRRRFVHNAVSGALLLKLSNEELKVEVGIGPLGHREGLLTAINDLEQHWQQQAEERQQQQQLARPGSAGGWEDGSPGSSPGSSRPGSPGPVLADAGVDYSQQRAFAQRAKLLRELEKAEGRQAHRNKAAEQAMRVVGQASDEVRKLQASICEMDRQLGWQAATQQLCDPLDVHGAVAWQPAGKQRATPQRPSTGSPARCGSPGGSPMSRVSRRLMEGGQGGGFLDRLQQDVASRQAKAAEATRRAGRYRGNGDEQMAEREQEARDINFIRELMEARASGLAEMLASGDPAQVTEACDDVAENYQAELGLADAVVAAVKRVGSPGRKAARLAGALRSAQFLQRLQHDMSTREGRVQELQDRFFKLEVGNSMEQQEAADLAAAQRHFALLGWSDGDLDVTADDSTAGCDAPLCALLKRVVAVQEARERGKPMPDWEQPEWRRDGLGGMQHECNAELQAALDQQEEARAAAAAEAGGRRGLKAVIRTKELTKPADRLGETVEMLAACRPAEVALLEGLTGYRKLMMCWRAVRAQQFIAFSRRDLEARKQKAKELEQQLYPDQTKVLPKEQFNAFFDRLMADTQRRSQNRDELAEKARAEALAKLMKSAPQPLSHRRQRPASAGGGR